MFILEVHDPYSTHSHLDDERFECDDVAKLADRIESVTGWSTRSSEIWADMVSRGDALDYTDPETGVEVTAKRVEQVGAGARG